MSTIENRSPGGYREQQPDAGAHGGDGMSGGVDLGPLFTTPQIYTDEYGVHTDCVGRRYDAVTIQGELAFVPAAPPAPAVVVGCGPVEDDPTGQMLAVTSDRDVDRLGEAARAALTGAVLGLPLGAWDLRVLAGLADDDSRNGFVVASLLRRAREAGVQAGRAEQAREPGDAR